MSRSIMCSYVLGHNYLFLAPKGGLLHIILSTDMRTSIRHVIECNNQ